MSEPVETTPADVDEEYDGPGWLVVGGREIAVHARLSGHFEPLAGRYRWAGRLHPSAEVCEAVRPNTGVRLRTAHGPAVDASIREEDPWGGFRVSGEGRPPFAVPSEPG